MRIPSSAPPLDTEASADLSLVRPAHLFVCAECRYAQLFAVEPRVLCTLRGASSQGEVLFAGQPACSGIAPRCGDDRTLAQCSPGRKTTASHVPHRSSHAA